MLSGFRDMTAALTVVGNRVDSLERTRDKEEGAEEAREKGRSAFMWKVGLIVSAVTTLAVIVANAVFHLITHTPI